MHKTFTNLDLEHCYIIHYGTEILIKYLKINNVNIVLE